MTFTFDKLANAAYIYLKKPKKSEAVEQESITSKYGKIVIDYDKHGNAIGVEVLFRE